MHKTKQNKAFNMRKFQESHQNKCCSHFYILYFFPLYSEYKPIGWSKSVAPERIWKWGLARKWGHQSGAKSPIRREAPEKVFLVVPLHFFGYKSTISHFGHRFRDGQYSLLSFLFAVLLLTVPPCPAFVKVGGHVPPVPYGVGATGRNKVSPKCILFLDLRMHPFKSITQSINQSITINYHASKSWPDNWPT